MMRSSALRLAYMPRHLRVHFAEGAPFVDVDLDAHDAPLGIGGDATGAVTGITPGTDLASVGHWTVEFECAAVALESVVMHLSDDASFRKVTVHRPFLIVDDWVQPILIQWPSRQFELLSVHQTKLS